MSLLAFLLLRLPYRDFIYQNDLWDFYIADTSPNFFAVLMFVFYKKWRSISANNRLLATGALLGLIFYEYVIQIHAYDATIDHLDSAASFLGACFSYAFCNFMDRNSRKTRLTVIAVVVFAAFAYLISDWQNFKAGLLGEEPIELNQNK